MVSPEKKEEITKTQPVSDRKSEVPNTVKFASQEKKEEPPKTAEKKSDEKP